MLHFVFVITNQLDQFGNDIGLFTGKKHGQTFLDYIQTLRFICNLKKTIALIFQENVGLNSYDQDFEYQWVFILIGGAFAAALTEFISITWVLLGKWAK